MFPNTLARLDQLGVLDRLRARHDIPLVQFSFRVLGHEVAGSLTAISATIGRRLSGDRSSTRRS